MDCANYRGTTPIHLGLPPHTWVESASCASPFPQLNTSHEEADNRMMFHIQDILSNQSEPTPITVYTGDTDVFVCLLYHIKVNWRDLSLQELWLICNSGVKRSILTLHDISTTLEMRLQGIFQLFMHWLAAMSPVGYQSKMLL